MRTGKLAALAAFVALTSSTAHSSGPGSCTAEANDSQRLQCYDAFFRKDLSPLATACEQILLNHLKAPAGYARVEVAETATDISLTEFVDGQFTRILRRYDADRAVSERASVREVEVKLRAESRLPKRHRIHITYDAPNFFNAPLRGAAYCSYVSAAEPVVSPVEADIDFHMTEEDRKIEYAQRSYQEESMRTRRPRYSPRQGVRRGSQPGTARR
ncbi:MAG: hypothetical protein H0T56_05320 [Pseudaminobacter sp.]|nr:hypothetical protein [Pseudaminobacter sp.]